MKYFQFLIFVLIISCKAYHSAPELSSLSDRNKIEIKKVNNFRYLGGLKNADGYILKDSLLYRSGNLHKLKTSSFDDFKALGIHKIIDLRTAQEVAKEPDHLPKNDFYRNYAAFEDKNNEMGTAKKLVLKGEIKQNDADKRMQKFYTDYVSENPHVIKSIIQEILNNDTPVLYHCTAGKDRTGIITALILKILRFDNQVIFEEYLQSNNLRKKLVQKRLNLAHHLHFVYPKLDIGVIEKGSWVERNYLQAAFDEINEKYGSMDNYIHNVLGISEAQRNLYIKKFMK